MHLRQHTRHLHGCLRRRIHASALFPGVNAVAKAHGWKLIPYFKIDCPFLDITGLQWYGPPTIDYPQCAVWNAAVLNKIKAHPPNLVLISMSRWIFSSDPTQTTLAAEANRREDDHEGPGQCPGRGNPGSAAAYRREVPDCLASNLSDYRLCAYNRKPASGVDGDAREGRDRGHGCGPDRPDQLHLPRHWRCPVVIDNMIVWRDEHHLTATFSASLAPAIDAQLVGILNASWAHRSALLMRQPIRRASHPSAGKKPRSTSAVPVAGTAGPAVA